jgi:2-polyprenyl-6-methoxyphenol hydroxylase-like FAD-dependent oxidoreductase
LEIAMEILISGAGIAGPALAYWLGRYGFRPTIVEIAPRLRAGGNAVDFRGPLHLGVLRRMGGVLGELEKVRTGGTAFRFVDEHDRTLMQWPAEFAGGDLEVQRGDLARVLCAAGEDRTEYLFGDSIATMTEHPAGVDVTFTSGVRRTFDLVIGADGVHSAVRRLTFGPESRFVKHLGYYLAGWQVPNEWGADGDLVLYNVPGRMASVGADRHDPARAGAFLTFASPPLDYDRRDEAAKRRIIRERYGDLGWRVPALLSALDDAPDLYFDQICRVDLPHWAKGRVALVGDAACGATIGGQGNGTALVAAYALAGELAAAAGDHTIAFARYEQRIAKFARGTQRGGDTTGRFLAPRTARGLRIRNGLHNLGWFMTLSSKIAKDRSTNVDLPEYESLARR